jgi:hypothetical protein
VSNCVTCHQHHKSHCTKLRLCFCAECTLPVSIVRLRDVIFTDTITAPFSTLRGPQLHSNWTAPRPSYSTSRSSLSLFNQTKVGLVQLTRLLSWGINCRPGHICPVLVSCPHQNVNRQRIVQSRTYLREGDMFVILNPCCRNVSHYINIYFSQHSLVNYENLWESTHIYVIRLIYLSSMQ